MKSIGQILILSVALASCGPLSTYYRDGVSVSRQQSEILDCQVSSLRYAPVANEIRQSPPIYFPGRTVCNASGHCYVTPGWWQPGNVYTVDRNAGLRAQVERQCMAQKGFAPVELPRCKQNVTAQVFPAPNSKLPALGPNSCIAKLGDGTLRIVTPQSSE